MKKLITLVLFLLALSTQANTQYVRYASDVNPMDILSIEPRLMEVMGTISEFCKANNVTFMVTSIIRTPKRNLEVRATSNTHVEGRAFDFSTRSRWGWTPNLLKEVVELVERKHGHFGEFAEGKRQKVIIIHKVKGGDIHGHVQIARFRNQSEYIIDKLNEIVRIE